MRNKTKLAEIFERAATSKRLRPWNIGCCAALDEATKDSTSRVYVRKLFYRMHFDYRSSVWWFGEKTPRNQRMRRAYLLEVAMNLKAQGYAK